MLVRIKGAPGEEAQQEPPLKRAFIDRNIFMIYERELLNVGGGKTSISADVLTGTFTFSKWSCLFVDVLLK